jgi:hypothetical protein
MSKVAGIISLDVGDYNVMVEYEGRWENDGIGSYEYWGAKCYDQGRDYVVIDKIEPVWTDESPRDRVEIKVLIRKNYDEYAEKIAERVEADVQEGDDDNS